MRCAAYSAVTNQSVYLQIVIIFSVTPYSPLHTPTTDAKYDQSAIAHFHDKLLRLRDRLKTDAGKELGQRRHKLVSSVVVYLLSQIITTYLLLQMVQFLEEISAEYDNSA